MRLIASRAADSLRRYSPYRANKRIRWARRVRLAASVAARLAARIRRYFAFLSGEMFSFSRAVSDLALIRARSLSIGPAGAATRAWPRIKMAEAANTRRLNTLGAPFDWKVIVGAERVVSPRGRLILALHLHQMSDGG